MRIISGKYRGKQLFPGKKFSARPTTDFAKESLFNIIGNQFDIESIRVLDLFSGTGSISFEFASRGCLSVESVESNRHHHAYIRKTSAALGFVQMKVFQLDAFAYIKKCNSKYDLVFADPPYDLAGIGILPILIFECGLLLPGGWFILEHSSAHKFNDLPYYKEIRKYGSVHFSIFENPL